MRLIVIGSPVERRNLRDGIDSSPVDVVAEFRSVAEARASGIVADALLVVPRQPGPLEDDELPGEELTPREVEVLERVAEGLSNKAIADRLGISDQTVKFHVASISGKLGAVNRTDAVRRAVRKGLVTL